MIIFLTGDKKKQKEYVKQVCHEKLSKAKIHSIYRDDLESHSLEELLPFHSGLFAIRECFILYNIFKSVPVEQFFFHYKDSDNFIFLSEEKPTKDVLKFIKENNIPVKSFEEKKEKKWSGTKNFILADFVLGKKKKDAWLLYRELIEEGSSAEELHGILFWAVKNLALVLAGETQGMKPFMIKKYQGFSRNFSPRELLEYVTHLKRMLHERDRFSSLEEELELFILSH